MSPYLGAHHHVFIPDATILFLFLLLLHPIGTLQQSAGSPSDITSISISNGIYYISDSNSRFWKSSDKGSSWASIEGTGSFIAAYGNGMLAAAIGPKKQLHFRLPGGSWTLPNGFQDPHNGGARTTRIAGNKDGYLWFLTSEDIAIFTRYEDTTGTATTGLYARNLTLDGGLPYRINSPQFDYDKIAISSSTVFSISTSGMLLEYYGFPNVAWSKSSRHSLGRRVSGSDQFKWSDSSHHLHFFRFYLLGTAASAFTAISHRINFNHNKTARTCTIPTIPANKSTYSVAIILAIPIKLTSSHISFLKSSRAPVRSLIASNPIATKHNPTPNDLTPDPANSPLTGSNALTILVATFGSLLLLTVLAMRGLIIQRTVRAERRVDEVITGILVMAFGIPIILVLIATAMVVIQRTGRISAKMEEDTAFVKVAERTILRKEKQLNLQKRRLAMRPAAYRRPDSGQQGVLNAFASESFDGVPPEYEEEEGEDEDDEQEYDF
ncbi:hypothetical protein HDU97_004709 [Phlyctochytrium planicorne]|nr:hypothetical protein HDU97_004709 [Phlyctochytrium planicorne]